MKDAKSSVERTLDSAGSTKLRQIIFVIIESGMTLLVIQIVRMVLWIMDPNTRLEYIALQYFIGINKMFNVIIRTVHFYFFCFTEIFTWLGNRGLYTPPRIPRGVRAESEDCLSCLRTVRGLNSDKYWLKFQPNLKIRVRI